MTQTSRRFNEGSDAFWDHVDEVLLENELAMQRIVRRPGAIGGVAVRFSEELQDATGSDPDLVPEPPQAA